MRVKDLLHPGGMDFRRPTARGSRFLGCGTWKNWKISFFIFYYLFVLYPICVHLLPAFKLEVDAICVHFGVLIGEATQRSAIDVSSCSALGAWGFAVFGARRRGVRVSRRSAPRGSGISVLGARRFEIFGNRKSWSPSRLTQYCEVPTSNSKAESSATRHSLTLSAGVLATLTLGWGRGSGFFGIRRSGVRRFSALGARGFETFGPRRLGVRVVPALGAWGFKFFPRKSVRTLKFRRSWNRRTLFS